MAPVRHFIDDDTGYRRWLARHHDGYVINTYHSVSPRYMVLHRATCLSISVFSPETAGGFTERQYSKACGDTIEELRAWARANGRPDGTFTSTACNFCQP